MPDTTDIAARLAKLQPPGTIPRRQLPLSDFSKQLLAAAGLILDSGPADWLVLARIALKTAEQAIRASDIATGAAFVSDAMEYIRAAMEQLLREVERRAPEGER